MLRKRRRARWEETLTLEDGRVLWLRPIHPADAEPLRASFELLSPDEIRLRFLHPLKELTAEAAQQLTHVDPNNGVAFVLAEPNPPGEALVAAVARASLDTAGDTADFAIIVSRFVSRQGLGKVLMGKLIEWAQRRGLRRLHGDVLVENSAMLALAQSVGFSRQPGNEPGQVRVMLELPTKRRRRV